jgi:hypothetical protein
LFAARQSRGVENAITGSFVVFIRQMRLPVGIDLLALLLKVSVGRELIMANLMGIPKDSVIQYETAVKADSFLVMAQGML